MKITSTVTAGSNARATNMKLWASILAKAAADAPLAFHDAGQGMRSATIYVLSEADLEVILTALSKVQDEPTAKAIENLICRKVHDGTNFRFADPEVMAHWSMRQIYDYILSAGITPQMMKVIVAMPTQEACHMLGVKYTDKPRTFTACINKFIEQHLNK